jgi:hypothetical protein
VSQKVPRSFESPLNIPAGNSGKFTVEHEVFPAGKEMNVVSMRSALFTGQRPMSVVLSAPKRFHFLKESGNTWMSDVPEEQYSHQPVVDKLEGSVLIGGLGLGYIVKKLAMKDRVTSITVVEKSTHVITLVWKYLGVEPKGKVVQMDLFEFLKKNKEKFDYAFYDIWAGDGETVLKEYVLPLRELTEPFVKSEKRIICWQEDVMRGQTRQGLQGAVMMNFDKMLELSEEKFRELFDDNWHKHLIAFWNWVRKVKPTQDDALAVVPEYTDTYGMKSWRKRWSKWL